jgi:bifunctional DNA-binding transcriptional regulator/antitoxin component of YhaV-PrlF toxin-antitoxin module
MSVSVSDKRQVIIPAAIGERLGIALGCQRDRVLVGDAVDVRRVERAKPSRAEDDRAMLVCEEPGRRSPLGLRVAEAMRGGAA